MNDPPQVHFTHENRRLRETRADTPVLLLEEPQWCNAELCPSIADGHAKKQLTLRAAFDALVAGGVKNLHYRKGDDLFGTDGECTVDGVHPTDLGMLRCADALEPDLRRILGR